MAVHFEARKLGLKGLSPEHIPAAGIAHSDQTRTSLIAAKLGLTGFILPFFFLKDVYKRQSSSCVKR